MEKSETFRETCLYGSRQTYSPVTALSVAFVIMTAGSWKLESLWCASVRQRSDSRSSRVSSAASLPTRLRNKIHFFYTTCTIKRYISMPNMYSRRSRSRNSAPRNSAHFGDVSERMKINLWSPQSTSIQPTKDRPKPPNLLPPREISNCQNESRCDHVSRSTSDFGSDWV